MPSQKLEDILNLSLESTPEQRQRSDVLNVGFDVQEQTWELIVKYSGSLEKLAALGMQVEQLLAGYAIVTLPQRLIPTLTAAEEVEFVEMPKNLLNGLYEAKRVSCILPLTGSSAGRSGGAGNSGSAGRPGGTDHLSGGGVLLAVIDSGIDYYLPDFRNPDGTSRIAWLWDQTLDADALHAAAQNAAARNAAAQNTAAETTAQPDAEEGSRQQNGASLFSPPAGFSVGVEFSKEQLDAALATGSREGAFKMVPSIDRSGHGTAVAAIAAGSNPNPQLRGVAAGAQLLVVKLGNRQTGFPHTTELMRAVTWALSKARQMGMPLAVNLSFGNSYGPHDGSSLLSRFLDNAAESGRTVICVGSGNDGASAGHTAGRLAKGRAADAPGAGSVSGRQGAGSVSGRQGTDSVSGQPGAGSDVQTVELVVADYERTLSIQLWKNYADLFGVTLRTPSGQEIAVQFGQVGRQQVRTSQTEVLIYAGQPSPYSVQQEIFFDLLPIGNTIEAGVWSIRLEGLQIVSGEYQLYLPGQEVRRSGTRFVRPTPELTLTIPGTAVKVLTVGAIQAEYESYADFSGRGAQIFRENETVFADTKPDIAAPGVNLLVPAASGGTMQVTGTSFATPLVTGTAALLMEWGIVQGNDPYLYGEKMKAFLRRGARSLRGETVYPNNRVGYGALCAAESVPL